MPDVYANGMEIACKDGGGKVIAAFPDVCLSPPSPPAGPIPIPYPISSFSSDTADGSKSVKIGGKEVMLKDKSNYKKCTGDEPATKTLGMGVITHCITGKTYFAMWSPDVIIEGENVDRHLDITNGNGQSNTNQYCWPNLDKMMVGGRSCSEILAEEGIKVHPYKHRKKNCKKGKQQSDHIIQNACFQTSRGGNAIGASRRYTMDNAPCICLGDGTNPRTEHGRKSAAQREWTLAQQKKKGPPTYAQARDSNLKAVEKAKPGISEEALACLKKVCDSHFKKDLNMDDDTPVRKPKVGGSKRAKKSTRRRR